uniref:NADH dehydrogenase [ubiquinone] 1 beta subcomplex subunit 11, mitochondrial n=1 Tax=Eucampia antarctica TaxID=49252 RepID=A0A7S2WJX2_9STRA|mmetsp:Transcript_3731/g.3513  ORF Transcript_3731/g.3513 Transcript_3731/m.3513 type:complete len:157 (+) Transcript_3731:156-626(+)|eukprot:CAMPEP_0197834652 /NCGR_PEP_ID=MMETSP1437-20131217/23193_1 /TAXON_ID=49252 ORGANISM="Eucampia antarctica, Strain CCMP1452" /NCGR_SAMPLE_ID=MMETSP1437 /ASSEMBLY_ACC=CAM_ASM_001096 /LENGTH=156 /DNA_ID=CAMNT_0043439513 /DNA_START=154 /DNA_END=624 /DNA_ORIENTATION=+
MNALRQAARQSTTVRRAVVTTAQRRNMGGAQPVSQSMKAELWGGHSKEAEGWETTLYATYVGATILITMALGFAPDTTITTWASEEAQARLDLQANGKMNAVEFGAHYNVPENMFDWESVNPDDPFNEDLEDDDDDDDEDEEDDDDEEEDDDDDEE